MPKEKAGADVNLAHEQYDTLNKKFYKNYPNEYFLERMQDTAIKIFNPDIYTEKLSNLDITVGSMKIRTSWDSDEQVRQYAKIELSELYTHCLESFIRLFIARASMSGCEWLELNRLSIKGYHSIINKLAQGDFKSLNSHFSENVTIQYALTGISNKCEEIDEDVILNWKEWVVFCASELKDIKAYNSYKHGLSLHTIESGLSIQVENEGDFGKHGDVLSYLMRSEKEDRFVWVEKTEFLNIEDICFKIFIFGQLISGMIKVGRFTYLGEEIKERWYPNKEITISFLKNNSSYDIESIFNAMKSYSIELLYYKTD